MGELDLKTFLGAYGGSTVDFLRFNGNYGDSLIWHGTQILLSEVGIVSRYVDLNDSKHNNILLIDGGGNFVPYYSDVRDFLLLNADAYEEVIILPHTIFGEEQVKVLKRLISKVTVFCRERPSYEFLNTSLPDLNIYLWHDCAFYNSFTKVPTGSGLLNAFREDVESTMKVLPENNADISKNGYATKPLDEMISIIQKYSEVHTDRLHIAICAALLGKKVILHPNSYYKNRAVYDYYLNKFQNVSFVA